MNEQYFTLIRTEYENSRGNSIQLFQILLAIGSEAGFEHALEFLEQCVTDKRLNWLERNRAQLTITGDPVRDGYSLFYESYLGLSVPKDGEIIVETPRRMVTRWWNRCPTLEACQNLGLDTRIICKKAYQRPVQALLTRLHAGLKFERNYDCIRPYVPYCEEIITLDEPDGQIPPVDHDDLASSY